MTTQTLKKQIRIAAMSILSRYDILMAEAISAELSETIHAVITARKRVKISTCPHEWMRELYHVCGVSEFTATVAMRHQVSECGQVLINSGATLDDLSAFVCWWNSNVWRVKNIPTPTPKQVRDNWGKFLNERNSQMVVDSAIPSELANETFTVRV